MFDWTRRAPRFVLAAVALLGIVMPPALGAPTPEPAAAPPVVAVSVTGNTHISTDRILAVVRTKVGDPFDPKLVQDDLRAISDLGFFSDQAPPVIKQRPDGIAITFRVIENPVITSIRFTGNKSVSSDTLLALMDTATGQVFNLKTYQQDVLKLNSYYDKIGFGGQVPSHVTDVNIDPSGVLTLKLQEGLTVRNVIIVPPPQADPLLPPNLIIKALVTKAGSPYSEDQRDKDVEALKKLYQQYDLTVGDFEAGIDPATVDTKTGTADVRYSISVARVGAIEITGNTKTHDDVIRRELRLRPGMVVTDSGVKNDYNRLNNLGFFEKVDITSNPGPDPKKPALITLKWTVKEQRTGTAQVGAGYSGGLTGTGLVGTLSYQENNINGTGNGASVRVERGARISDAQLQFSVPYLGHTEQSQKYSLGATIFTQATTNFYPVYLAAVAPAPGITPTPLPANANVPVAIVPADPTNYVLENGVASTYKSTSSGLSLTVGRRLTDYVTASLGTNIQSVSATATVPLPFYFPTSQPLSTVPTTNTGLSSLTGSSNNSASAAIGITGPSLAQVDSTRPYALHSLVLGLATNTLDDIQNPRRGWRASVSDEYSTKFIGSAFNYSLYTIDGARFFPVLKNATFGVHTKIGITQGAIPTNKLFTFSDQDLRGYTNPFYGTDIALFQSELRVPLTADRKFAVVGFAETGGTRIRGGVQINADNSQLNLNNYQFHSDLGVGLRFDVPQLGLKTIRLDFAKGSQGTHTAFGIGQSF